MVTHPDPKDYARDLSRLEILLEDSERPVVAFVLVNNFANFQQSTTELEQNLTKPIETSRVEPSDLNPFHVLNQLPPSPPRVVCIWFAGSSLAKSQDEPSDLEVFAKFLNYQRERIQEFNHSLLLFLPEDLMVRFVNLAPDFWSWRGGVFDLRVMTEVVTPVPSYERGIYEEDAYSAERLKLQVDLYQELLHSEQDKLEPNQEFVVETLIKLASAKRKLGRVDDGIKDARKALAIAKELDKPLVEAKALNQLGEELTYSGFYLEAEPLFQEALRIRQQVLPHSNEDVAYSLNNLAELFRYQGRYSEAESLLVEALETRRKALPEGHPDIATSLSNLAGIYRSQGRYSEAESLLVEALETRRKALPEGHPDIARGLNNLALLYDTQGRYSEAEPLYLEALEINRIALPEGHPDIAASLNNLAALYNTRNLTGQAEKLLHESAEIMNRKFGDQSANPDHARYLSNLAVILLRRGKTRESQKIRAQANAIQARHAKANQKKK